MQVSASIRQSWGLNHYGEFDSFERADKHLTGEGWKCVKTTNNGASRIGGSTSKVRKFWC